jgi:hypothetical protein
MLLEGATAKTFQLGGSLVRSYFGRYFGRFLGPGGFASVCSALSAANG